MTVLKQLSPVHSIRIRLALVGTAVLFVCLAVGGVAFDRVLERQLSNNLDLRLTSQAADRASAIQAGLDPAVQLQTAQTETAVAVFDADGAVVASRGFADPSAVADVAPGDVVTREITYIEERENEIELTDLRVVAAQSGSMTVVVASEFNDVSDPLEAARRLLFIAIPLVAFAGGFVLWMMVGRSLKPVEQIRRDAQAIADVGAAGRVHQPEHSDELGRLASTMNDMLERLDQSAITLRRFVSDSSHEIRSPITNIRARIETSKPEDWEAVRTDVVGEVERVEAIIDDLTYLARSDEGRVESRFERVDLDEVMFDEAQRLQQRGKVRVDASGIEPVVAVADRSQIRRAVRNLVDNAERHAEGRIRLSVASGISGDVVIEVADDGPGVALANRARVFERFARLDESRERSSGGTGLGLAIVRDIVERHDGQIEIADAAMGGALIRITLTDQSAPTGLVQKSA